MFIYNDLTQVRTAHIIQKYILDQIWKSSLNLLPGSGGDISSLKLNLNYESPTAGKLSIRSVIFDQELKRPSLFAGTG